MKKTYKKPELKQLELCIETFITASGGEPLIDGVIDDGSNSGQGTTIISGGDGTGTDDPGAKGTGRFWDDEY